MTAYTAAHLTTSSLFKLINQSAHGFTVGQIVNFDGGAPPYVLCKADNILDSQGCLMVSNVLDVNNFFVTQVGYVTNLATPLSAPNVGVQLYLSPTSAGNLTSTKPAAVGQYIVPCFVADTTTSGFFFGGTGTQVESSVIFSWTIQGVNTTMGVNQGYMTSSGGTVQLTLPATSAVGDMIRITNLLGQFQVVQASGQQITLGFEATTLGAGGSLTSTKIGDSLEMVCVNTNVDWQVLSSMGNITVV